MGTNYYHRRKKCTCCGHQEEGIHIGKSSFGWCFGLHVYPDEGPRNLSDWKIEWLDSTKEIVDEYGRTVTADEMLAVIADRSFERKSAGFDYASNHAEPGPNGLARSQVDGTHCIGHGDGTYDLIVGEFS